MNKKTRILNFDKADDYFEFLRMKEEWLNKEFKEATKSIKIL
jgi:hypothetical protein